MLFLFKSASRNEFDNKRKDSGFVKNYFNVFGLRLPSTEAIDDFFKILCNDALETLKGHLISVLIEKKVFHRFRFLGLWTVENLFFNQDAHQMTFEGFQSVIAQDFEQIVYCFRTGQPKSEDIEIIFDETRILALVVKFVTRGGFEQKQHHASKYQFFNTVLLTGTVVRQLVDSL